MPPGQHVKLMRKKVTTTGSQPFSVVSVLRSVASEYLDDSMYDRNMGWPMATVIGKRTPMVCAQDSLSVLTWYDSWTGELPALVPGSPVSWPHHLAAVPWHLSGLLMRIE